MGAKTPLLDFGQDAGPSLMHADKVARKPDFSGWATKAGVKCTDGRTILPGAFKHQDKLQVPLVWQHTHDDPTNVLGHVLLEDRDEGTYCYGFLNSTPKGVNTKTLLEHGDVNSLSIFANALVEKAKEVSHGIIREVSLVLAGANPQAIIDNIELRHSDGSLVEIEDEAVIKFGLTLSHGAEETVLDEEPTNEGGRTVSEEYDAMTDDQKAVVLHFVGAAMEAQPDPEDKTSEITHSGASPDDDKDKHIMKRNLFDAQNGGGAATEEQRHTLSHDALRGIAEDAVKLGSLKEAFESYALKHGIENIETLFPDAKAVGPIEWDKRRTEWVSAVLNKTKKVPYSRIKSVVADITADEARARGYIKANFKKEEWFKLAKRTTGPTTIYKKQKLDRDDIIDITDLDVVSWMKGEMRLMLDEEIARALLIGDGRSFEDEDKIRDPQGERDGLGIRSILHDDELYATTIYVNIDDEDSKPSEVTDAILLNMERYKGSGNPVLYSTLGRITKMLLERDAMGRRLYRTRAELATELQVADIVDVEVFDQEPDLFGIIVNLGAYTLGADRGGDVAMFDDFDIDYNQYKYLIETRCSGALTKIRSAIIVKLAAANQDLVEPQVPGFNASTGVVTIPNQTGVVYKNKANNATLTSGAQTALAPGASVTIYAVPGSGFYFSDNQDDEFTYTRAS